jgi:hypothetical protein
MILKPLSTWREKAKIRRLVLIFNNLRKMTTHYSLLTTHYSLLTTHYSLLTTPANSTQN